MSTAALWLEGELVHLEDLVLHDAGMDIRAPTHELTRAHAVLRARRRIADAVPGWALSPAGLEALRGRAGQSDATHPEVEDPEPVDDEEAFDPPIAAPAKTRRPPLDLPAARADRVRALTATYLGGHDRQGAREVYPGRSGRGPGLGRDRTIRPRG